MFSSSLSNTSRWIQTYNEYIPQYSVHTRYGNRIICESYPNKDDFSPSTTSTVNFQRRQSLVVATLVATTTAISSSPFVSLSLASAYAAEDAALPGHSGGTLPKAFFDVTVDGKPLGRFVVAMNRTSENSVAVQRFLDLAQGKEGVGYRRTRIDLVQDGYIQNTGVKSLSYKAGGQTTVTGGIDAEMVEIELDKSNQKNLNLHDSTYLVSLVVKRKADRESKEKLVAVNGQLVTVTETLGELPNGSGFTITTGSKIERESKSLDATNLVVGRVVEGQEVVDALAALPRVKDNSASPFFKAGKAAGDKRANVAERAFGKPFAKIIIAECGLLQ